VQQEVHHVGLGEELGDCGKFVCANLDFRGVDFVFALGLPVLLHPAQAVAGLVDFVGKSSQKAFEFALVLDGKGHVKYRVLRLKDLRQHAGG
jgi:hypothetical protein